MRTINLQEIKKMPEQEKRDIYKKVFSREYDSEDRKQPPLPLNIACAVAMIALNAHIDEIGSQILIDYAKAKINERSEPDVWHSHSDRI